MLCEASPGGCTSGVVSEEGVGEDKACDVAGGCCQAHDKHERCYAGYLGGEEQPECWGFGCEAPFVAGCAFGGCHVGASV